ncbi:helix-turn-helix domain-containing protein [Dethiosulfatarculus sandiegensis]|uniref:HTH cro/C1-type domain-containing protein n=1 Tax=Dethiosulfatarculus sandiegensis TaxID=1429043 RepID=A0A0D2J825_9BACT|nr:XRE family transcriptional regulator [Dethiosulfatarculus sandiegensis]KIX11866.1 hypothetical protein X474_21780 [Dethiosulfatarculus sandiegensis]
MRTGTPGFQPERLVEAREIRGLTQLALGELIKKPNTTISRWEKGIQSPENDALHVLASALNVPVSFFFKTVYKNENKPFFFRSMASATLQERKRTKNRMRWLQEISIFLQELVELPAVNVPQIGVKNYQEIAENDIEKAADSCRKLWGLGNGPILNLLLALENNGIVIGKEKIGSTKMDGLSNWCELDGRPYLLIASDKDSCVRSRLDAAHEVGHLVLHSNIDRDMLTKKEHFKEIEAQAFKFAGCFLMPSDTFAAEVWSPSLDAFLVLKERWKTSISAMIMRCRDLGLTSDEYEKRLWKYYSYRGWRKKEPLDDTLAIEKPKLLRRAIELLIKEGVYSRQQLIDNLHLPSYDVEHLCSLPVDFFEKSSTSKIVNLPRIRKNKANNKKKYRGDVVPFRKD